MLFPGSGVLLDAPPRPENFRQADPPHWQIRPSFKNHELKPETPKSTNTIKNSWLLVVKSAFPNCQEVIVLCSLCPYLALGGLFPHTLHFTQVH